MITLTDLARTKIQKLINTKGYAGIRLGVKTTGCSGLAYVLEYVKEYEPDAGTINYAQNNFCVLVDKKHEVYLSGTQVDYVRQGLNEGFEFTNPNERDRCGCGESFRV
jgi:iron-sulfur cluster assembly protein